LLRAELEDVGLEARVKLKRVRGRFGLTSIADAVGGRGLARAAALIAADDLEPGPRVLRRALPRRWAANVLARAGPDDARGTLVVHAHQIAAQILAPGQDS
jgi:hypothetical protein